VPPGTRVSLFALPLCHRRLRHRSHRPHPAV